jgi:histidinol-phosphatase (PHP family)
VHYFSGAEKMFDGADQAQQLVEKGIELAFEEYRGQLEIVIGRGNIDCLSHLDLIKIHALIPDSYDPAAFFAPILERIRSADLALEINTAGWRKKIEEQYPSEPILKTAINLGIPITISSDAHSYVQVGEDYDRLGQVADRVGLQKPTRYWRHERRS